MSTFPSTLSYVSFVITVCSFCLTILNLLALYSNFLATVRAAPEDIQDELGSLRAQLLEEREALRQQTRELRAKQGQIRDASRRAPNRAHPAHRGRPRSASRSFDNLRTMMASSYSLTHAEQTLGLHSQTIRDLWRRFKALERPFLIPPRDGEAAAEPVHRRTPWGGDDELGNEKGVREDAEMSGEMGSDGTHSLLYQCGFFHRFLWWWNKKDVIKLADTVQNVMLRRMEREVTCTRMMVKQLRDGGDGPEDILNPRFDSGGGGLGGYGGIDRTAMENKNGSQSRGPTPMGLMRRPIGETYNVYESSDSGSDSATRMKRRMKELENNNNRARMQALEVTKHNGPPQRPMSAGQRNDSYELRHTASGRTLRQGQHMRVVDGMNTRAPAPIILQAPPQKRPKTRHGYEGSPRMPLSPFDGRR